MDANAWLEHVGWATHLEGFDPEAMLRLTDPVSEHEHALQLIQDSLMRVMNRARAIATPAQVGSQALFEAQRKEVDKKPRRPFDNRMEDDTWARYTAVWSKLICYIYRAEALEDDKKQDRVGYSFLEDDRNRTWLEAGKNWSIRRITDSAARRKIWFDHGREDGKPFRARAVQSYGQTVKELMERMFLLMHMVSGQPARATEILSIRHKNTMNGGVRNIFAHNGLICFVTSYHKSFRATGQAKVIHRYLPREVSELLVWYLWLVLPFWQQVQGIIKDAGIRSSYSWPDEVVRKVEISETEQRERRQADIETGSGEDGFGSGNGGRGDDDDDDNADPNIKLESWVEERNWTSDRVRRIIQRHSRRLLGTMLNISSWRQIAVAIARRYLNGAFKESTLDEDEYDDIEDRPVDLQAGHGTHVAGMVYAREMQQGLFSTATMRDKFRSVSRQWHRLLEFRDGDEFSDRAGGAWRRKREREPFETEQEHNQLQRFRRMQQVDIAGQLRQMLGPDAAFRGQQEAVIRAIMRGESPVVQITGTRSPPSFS
jgi:hypothetical protein